jgi:hypothetical protein
MSMEKYATQDGDRPDLADIRVNPPEGYIGFQLFPPVGIAERGGETSYMVVFDDQVPQVNRARGADLATEYLFPATHNFSVAPIERRFSVDWRDVKVFGGVDVADRHGVTMAKRSIYRAVEDLQAATAMAGPVTPVSGDIVEDIMTSLPLLKRYTGETALVLSYSQWRWMIQQDEIVNAIGRSIARTDVGVVDVMAMSVNHVRLIMQNIYNLDHILVGDDVHWTTPDNRALLCKIPPATAL